MAMLRYTENTLPELIYLHQIPEGMRGFKDWFQGSTTSEKLTIVSEQWVEHEVKGADRTPTYIEGIEFAFWDDDVVYQTPDMKQLISDEWLQENNLWTPGKRHQMDALIHALVYLRNNDHRPTQESLADDGEESEPMAQPGDAEDAQISEEGSEQGENEREFMEAMGQEADDEEGEEEGSVEDVEEGETQGEGKPTNVIGYGPGGDNEKREHGKLEEPKGTRKQRELNGTFAGYDVDDGGKSTDLFEGKL